MYYFCKFNKTRTQHFMEAQPFFSGLTHKKNLTKKCWLGFVGWSTDNIVIRLVHGKAITTDFSHIK